MINKNFVTPAEIIRERKASNGRDGGVDLAGWDRDYYKYLWWDPKKNSYGIGTSICRSIRSYPCRSLGEAVTFYNLIDVGKTGE